MPSSNNDLSVCPGGGNWSTVLADDLLLLLLPRLPIYLDTRGRRIKCLKKRRSLLRLISSDVCALEAQAENHGCGSLPVVIGRSLPRAMGSAAAAAFTGRAPAFEGAMHSSGSRTPAAPTSADGHGARTASSVELEDMLVGHPSRAMQEVEMRSRLEIVKEEVEAALRLHGSLAEGERESWLKRIERRNEEDAYQVGKYAAERW